MPHAECQIKDGGMTHEQRIACFADFEATNPSAEEVVEFYECWANDYNDDMDQAQYKNPLAVADTLAELVPESERADFSVLDICAGSGEAGQRLHANGFKMIDATDGSAQMLELAKATKAYRKVFEPELLKEGKPMTSITGCHYDAIVCCGSFYPHHLNGMHLKCFVHLVKPGGKLVISSCPANDKNVKMRPALKQLEAESTIHVVKETSVKMFRKHDGMFQPLLLFKLITAVQSNPAHDACHILNATCTVIPIRDLSAF